MCFQTGICGAGGLGGLHEFAGMDADQGKVVHLVERTGLAVDLAADGVDGRGWIGELADAAEFLEVSKGGKFGGFRRRCG